MPKKLKVWPNERVDLPDFEHAANEYTEDYISFEQEKVLLDRRSRVLEGFRIQIDDQSANPGQVTIHNGNALDREGKHLFEESSNTSSVTVTLSGASTTFYLELEQVSTETDTDARAFWDPEFNNGGAPNPDGKEFNFSVATRQTPTWRVVQPISTTGFQSTTNPNSNRIPLAVLATDGSNQITAGSTPGLVQVTAASVLENDYSIGDNTVRVLDSRLLGTTGDSITIDFGSGSPETVTISTNDVDNGVISFAPALAADHLAGAIVRGTNARLLEERRDPTDTSVPERTPRLWQADEIRGSGIASSKDTFGAKDDLNIRSLKDYVDFMSGLVREIKFGDARTDVISQDPPSSFSSTRYYDNSGGIAGSRLAAVSVGDGVTSYGDYNGTDEAPFASAAAFLNARGGGVLFVKAGTYTFAAAGVTFTSNVVVVGEHKDEVVIVNNTAGRVFTFSPGDGSVLKDLTISTGTGSSILCTWTAGFSVIENVDLGGSIQITGTVVPFWKYFNIIDTSANHAVNISGTLQNGVLQGCQIAEAGASNIFDGQITNTVILGGILQGTGGGNTWTVRGTCNDVTFQDVNIFNTTATGFVVVPASVTFSGLKVRGCKITTTGFGAGDDFLFQNLSAVSDIWFDSCRVSAAGSGTGSVNPCKGFNFQEDVTNFKLSSCEFDFTTTSEYVDWIDLDNTVVSASADNLVITGCVFTNFRRAINATNVWGGQCVVSGCEFAGGGLAGVQYAARFDWNNFDVKFVNNRVYDMSGTGAKTCILLQDTGGTYKFVVSGNVFDNIGNPTSISTVRAIEIGSGNARGVVANNVISKLDSDNIGTGIYINCDTATSAVVVEANSIRNLIGGANATVIAGIHMQQGGKVVLGDNNIIDVAATGAAATAKVASLYFTNNTTSHVLAKGNHLSQVDGPTAGKDFTGCVVINEANNISLRDNYLIDHGTDDVGQLVLIYTATSISEISVCNNHMKILNASTQYGVHVKYDAVGPQNLSINGNHISGLSYVGAGSFIFLDQTAAAAACPNNVQISNNILKEGTFHADHGGIVIENNGSSTVRSRGVVVSGNSIFNEDGASGTRSAVNPNGRAIFLGYIQEFSLTGNNVKWCDSNIGGGSINIANSQFGIVAGNHVTPGNNVTNEFNLATCTDIQVGNNVFGNTVQPGTYSATGTGVVDVNNKA